MTEPRIAELRYKPRRGSPWAALRGGMTRAEARAAVGVRAVEIMERVRRGLIIFDPPIQLCGQAVKPNPKLRDRPISYRKPASSKTRPCLCCQQLFESHGPGNRMCERCRMRDVSPFAPG